MVGGYGGGGIGQGGVGAVMQLLCAHPNSIVMDHIDLIFFPPNTTSTLQPLDMGVIRNLKCHYRSAINKRVIRDLDANAETRASEVVKRIKLIDCIYLLKDAWSKVQPATINNCFAHAGFKAPDIETLETFETPDNLTTEDWVEFVDFDNDTETTGDLDDEEITQGVKRRKLNPADETVEEDDHEDEQTTRLQLNTALDTVRSFLQTNRLESSRLKLQDIARDVSSVFAAKQTQSAITSFFPAPTSPASH